MINGAQSNTNGRATSSRQPWAVAALRPEQQAGEQLKPV
eukprot:CAMPEP_0176284134 /NCGR_PEP_ID=MMETSP0121_2-20121125/51686_1 /TAXON_ID=160619 /ORGANISM="Kryptoperidinium foliaceum, Strain CCMP 1326" /LENGTH=38 /DNA_ID= /DNA_START= /DNA_END= /DNA_ORIENTATION=